MWKLNIFCYKLGVNLNKNMFKNMNYCKCICILIRKINVRSKENVFVL